MPPNIHDYQRRLTTIGATVLRNMGAPGMVAAAREFVTTMDLAALVLPTESTFLAKLDEQTKALEVALPARGSSSGAARKSLNLFLGEAYYHQFVCRAYGLERIAPWLEVPLDSQVAAFLRREAAERSVMLPAWLGVKWLTPTDSAYYQAFAASMRWAGVRGGIGFMWI